MVENIVIIQQWRGIEQRGWYINNLHPYKKKWYYHLKNKQTKKNTMTLRKAVIQFFNFLRINFSILGEKKM